MKSKTECQSSKGRVTSTSEGGEAHRILVVEDVASKSVLIHTITSCIQQLFDFNNVPAEGCLTGTPAFTVFGKTMHCLTAQGISCDYKPFSMMSKSKKDLLCKKFNQLLLTNSLLLPQSYSVQQPKSCLKQYSLVATLMILLGVYLF
jgi:hypothetical protein